MSLPSCERIICGQTWVLWVSCTCCGSSSTSRTPRLGCPAKVQNSGFFCHRFSFSDFRIIVMNDMCKNNLSLSTNHLETTRRNIKSCKYYPFVSEQKKRKGGGWQKGKIEMKWLKRGGRTKWERKLKEEIRKSRNRNKGE